MKKIATLMFLFLFFPNLTVQAQSLEERIESLEGAITRIEKKIDQILVDRKISTAPFWEELISDQECDQEKLIKTHYSICYHRDWKIPVWVGYHLTEENLKGAAKRKDDFREDQALHPDLRSTLKDYRGSKHDRGHMAPAAAFKRSKDAMSETFFLSNMAPQTPQLNRAIWRFLEEDVRKVARSRGPVWVFTGNLFLDKEEIPITPATRIGTGKVAVPTHCFKVILLRDKDDKWRGYAFLMPNQRKKILGIVSDFQTSIDSIEKKSGVDFFALLPDKLEESIEDKSLEWPVEN